MHFAYDSYANNLENSGPEGRAWGTEKVEEQNQQRCINLPTGEERAETRKTANLSNDLTIDN